jgi:parvulin-like peptidyl-prolyl isomerase
MKISSQKLVCKVTALIAGLVFSVILSPSIFAMTLDRIVAKVNSDVITLMKLEDRVTVFLNKMKTAGSVDKKLDKKKLMKTVLEGMIAEKLQAQEAKKLGMVVTEEELQKYLDGIYATNNITGEEFENILKSEGSNFDDYKRIIRGQILVSRIVQMHVSSGSTPSEKYIRKYYRKNKKNFWVPRKMILSHIMFIEESDSSGKERRLQKNRAEKILRRIQAGENFSELAKKYSDDVSAHSGGRLGVVSRGTMLPEFEKAAFDLKVGEISNIVATVNGFHIIKCDNITPGYAKEFDLVKSEIKEMLSVKNREKKYQEWMDELKRKSFIEISLVSDGKGIKNVRGSNSVVKKGDFKPPITINPIQSSKKHNKHSRDEGLSVKRLVEIKLRKYKKLYANGKISKKIYLIKKKQLLEKL